MKQLFDAYFNPPLELTTYRLFQQALVAGVAISIVGMWRCPTELLGVATLAGIVVGAITGIRAFGDVGHAKWSPVEPPHPKQE